MKNVTIMSHLTPYEWKMSWQDKVVEDNNKNMRAYQQYDCFWGHFDKEKENDFIICHHKAGEVKSMSLGLYFNGHIEKDGKGSKITGTFGRKLSTNLFLGMGAILCILAIVGSLARNDTEVLIVSCILLVILFMVYFSRPQKGQQVILDHLQKISFDDKFHHIKVKKSKRKQTLSEIASADRSHVAVDAEAKSQDSVEN